MNRLKNRPVALQKVSTEADIEIAISDAAEALRTLKATVANHPDYIENGTFGKVIMRANQALDLIERDY